jgi:hypothetical protein
MSTSENYLGVREAAAELDYPARKLSDDLYAGRLDVSRCPLVAGRRLIPRNCLAEFRVALQRLRERRRERAEQEASAAK